METKCANTRTNGFNVTFRMDSTAVEILITKNTLIVLLYMDVDQYF